MLLDFILKTVLFNNLLVSMEKLKVLNKLNELVFYFIMYKNNFLLSPPQKKKPDTSLIL